MVFLPLFYVMAKAIKTKKIISCKSKASRRNCILGEFLQIKSGFAPILLIYLQLYDILLLRIVMSEWPLHHIFYCELILTFFLSFPSPQETLLHHLSKKMELLRAEQLSLKEETKLNEEVGRAITLQVMQTARPAECDKYKLHVEEIDKITSLLFGLSGRLAKAENALIALPEGSSDEEKVKTKTLKNDAMLFPGIVTRISGNSNVWHKTAGPNYVFIPPSLSPFFTVFQELKWNPPQLQVFALNQSRWLSRSLAPLLHNENQIANFLSINLWDQSVFGPLLLLLDFFFFFLFYCCCISLFAWKHPSSHNIWQMSAGSSVASSTTSSHLPC